MEIEKQKTNTETQDRPQKIQLFDFNIGYATTIILGIAFVALGAFVMYNSGDTFSGKGTVFAKQLIELYTKSLGNEFAIIIGIAAFTTMFSTTLTTLDASPRAMAKTTQLLLGKYLKHTYIFWMLVLVVGTIIILTLLLSEMGLLIKIATILSFITAPFYAILNFKLIKSKHTPENARPGKSLEILSYLGIFALIGFSVWYITTLF